MKRTSVVLVLALLLQLLSGLAMAEAMAYTQAPMLDAQVESGALPALEERLPANPKVFNDAPEAFLTPEKGVYGGTMRLVTSVVNWDADAFVLMTESMLTLDFDTGEVYGNLLDYTVSDDGTVFTFTLREGMRWSDGTPVTMEDFVFTWNDFVLNEELTPVVSNNLRAGGNSTGAVMDFAVVDDTTFTLTSEKAYGGFLLNLTFKGFPGYTDILKPAHYLKPFHIAYAEEIHGSVDAYYEFIRPFSDRMSFSDPADTGVWAQVFDVIDMTNWELTDPTDALTSVQFSGLIDENFPVLYPWMMESSEGGITSYVRNPYYFKVDAWGQQLPYLDRVTSTLVEDMEMVQMKIISGEADMARESATIDNVTLYREAAGIGLTTHLCSFTVYPVVLWFNMNYTEDPSFAEAMQYTDFRKALGWSIDCEEIIDAVYKGMAQPSRQEYVATYDPDKAMEMLDELGFVDVNGDGWRETPDGQIIKWDIYNAAQASDHIPVGELLTQYFQDVGINIGLKTVENAYLSTAAQANQLPMRVSWSAEAAMWTFMDWGTAGWAPLWHTWWQQGGLNAAEGEEIAGGEEPPEHVKDYYRLLEAYMQEVASVAQAEIVPQLIATVNENAWTLITVSDAYQCFVINTNYGNVSENDTSAHNRNLYGEIYFDRTFAE